MPYFSCCIFRHVPQLSFPIAFHSCFFQLFSQLFFCCVFRLHFRAAFHNCIFCISRLLLYAIFCGVILRLFRLHFSAVFLRLLLIAFFPHYMTTGIPDGFSPEKSVSGQSSFRFFRRGAFRRITVPRQTARPPSP
jgi:hypothetical protein